MTSLLRTALALVLTLGFWATTHAQTFPWKPVKLVVNFPAGGTIDAIARALSRPLSAVLGQPVLVENKPGALGMVGATVVSHAAADGHTVLMTSQGALTEHPVLNSKTPYNPLTAFESVTLFGETPFVLYSHPDFPANDVKGLIEYAKAQPQGVDISVSGSSIVLSVHALAAATGVKFVQIPFPGSPPAFNAAIGGHTKLGLNTTSTILTENVKAGRLKLLGVGTSEPTPLMPGVPVIADTVPGMVLGVWWAVFAPGGTPADAVAKLNAAFRTALADQAVLEAYRINNAVPRASTPDELKNMVVAGLERTRSLVKQYDLRVE